MLTSYSGLFEATVNTTTFNESLKAYTGFFGIEVFVCLPGNLYFRKKEAHSFLMVSDSYIN